MQAIVELSLRAAPAAAQVVWRGLLLLPGCSSWACRAEGRCSPACGAANGSLLVVSAVAVHAGVSKGRYWLLHHVCVLFQQVGVIPSQLPAQQSKGLGFGTGA